MSKIYLAGKVNGIKAEIAKKLKTQAAIVSSDLARITGGHSLDWHGGDVEHGLWPSEDTSEWVNTFVTKEIAGCDFLLAILDAPDSFGSIAEIAYASALGKSCFVITVDDGALSGQMSDAYWLITHFPHVTILPVGKALHAETLAQTICGLDSPIEIKLFEALACLGLEWEVVTQQQIGRYRADFAFPLNKLIVETDGQEFHSSADQRTWDAARDRFLSAEGWTVLRFTGREITRDPIKCGKEIAHHLYPEAIAQQ